MSAQQAVKVLLVEDNEGDVRLVRQSMAECDRPVELMVAWDGEEALRVLGGSQFSPQLVILDLNLPKVSGLTVLERLDSRSTPVVVFSSSCNPAEMQCALALGARECIRKPMDVRDFMCAVCGMVKNWVERQPLLASEVQSAPLTANPEG